MARPDFENVWGSTNAPFTATTDTDYKAGWVFRTGAPPRRVNFDYFQNLSDQRHAWLGEQMLQTVGHDWQSDVSYNLQAYTRSTVNGKLYKSLDAVNLGNEPSATPLKWREVPDLSEESADTVNATIATVAAAGTINLTTGAPNTSQLAISGTGVSINGFTVAANRFFVVKMTGASNTLVNTASLVTGGGANIPVVAGDSFLMRSTSANTVEILGFVENPTPRASLAANGYQKLPSGLIIQWGSGTSGSSAGVKANFSITFPNALLQCSATATGDNRTVSVNPTGTDASGIVVSGIAQSGSSNTDSATPFSYIVVGY